MLNVNNMALCDVIEALGGSYSAAPTPMYRMVTINGETRECTAHTAWQWLLALGLITFDWQWIGPHMSQRMFGITEKRAKEYAAKHGGKAEQMT